ncbi:hypothetical protein BH23CYA1_BH23CYA1_17320 [soil metagenome]
MGRLLAVAFNSLYSFFEQFVSNVEGVGFRAVMINGFSRKNRAKQLELWRCWQWANQS